MATEPRTGGFDVVLGNPPWDRPKPEPAKFFSAIRPDIANAATSAARATALESLRSHDPALFALWKAHERHILGSVRLLTGSGRFPLTAVGKFNLGNNFVELGRTIISGSGCAGLLNVSGLATDDSGKAFIDCVMSDGSLLSLFDFENKRGLFSGVHRMYKFSAITLAGTGDRSRAARFVFYAEDVKDLQRPERQITYSQDDILLLNPLSRTCPVFRDVREAELVKLFYQRASLCADAPRVLYRWDADPTFLFVMSDHSRLFVTREQLGVDTFTVDTITPYLRRCKYLPLYESKMFHQFEHRWARLTTDGTQRLFSFDERQDADAPAVPRYWMRETDANVKLDAFNAQWLIAVREVTNASNERTTIAAVLPKYPVGHNAQVFRFEHSAREACAFLANLNSFALDFAARTKVGGSHLSSFILRQLPILAAEDLQTTMRLMLGGGDSSIVSRVLELVYTSRDLEPFAADASYNGPPFIWNAARRHVIRCELDAAVFHAYLGSAAQWSCSVSPELARFFPTPRSAVEYVLETFPIIKARDEVEHCSYHTKEMILSIYDDMASANELAQPWSSQLAPSPGPPTDDDGCFIPADQWDSGDWPPHIHRRSEEET